MAGYSKLINIPLPGVDQDSFSKHKQDIYKTLDTVVGQGLFSQTPAVLSGGTVTVKQPQCTSNSQVTLTPQSGGSTGTLHVVCGNGSFVINSSDGSDTRKVAWWLWP